MHSEIACFIFDLDGVLVDTAKYHYQAWRKLANEMGFELSPETNELLKGVSRTRSLEIILGLVSIRASGDELDALAEKKNAWYLDYVTRMQPSEVLPNVRTFVKQARAKNIKTAIGSASKNTPTILERTGLASLFDAVVDGNVTTVAKPDPEVFLKAADRLSMPPPLCVVFEDSASGVTAARNAGMHVVGIGDPQSLKDADLVISGFSGITPTAILKQIEQRYRDRQITKSKSNP
ncbi:beta-phosphoglucomutase [Propionivibrio soli]|uniref:beta-phosphoglucomutase n=1 Tax=Propionivibrio soli TaxID=2976531 RepID=UPI0021E75D2E